MKLQGAAIKRFLAFNVPVPLWVFLSLAVVGIISAVWAAWPEKSRHAWLELREDAEGNIAGVMINPQKIPREVLKRLPNPQNAKPLSQDEIRLLAMQYGFFDDHQTNPQLRFNDGDIQYWVSKKRPGWELELEFLSRQLVLDAAEEKQITIPYQGDLSKWGERVYPILVKKTLEKK